MIPYINSFKLLLQELQDRVWIWKRDESIKQGIIEEMQTNLDQLRKHAENISNRLT